MFGTFTAISGVLLHSLLKSIILASRSNKLQHTQQTRVSVRFVHTHIGVPAQGGLITLDPTRCLTAVPLVALSSLVVCLAT